jgi:hypothetical protein
VKPKIGAERLCRRVEQAFGQRMNPYVRSNPAAMRAYFDLLDLDEEERRRERCYFLFNLVEYVNWYYLDSAFDRVHEHLALFESAL